MGWSERGWDGCLGSRHCLCDGGTCSITSYFCYKLKTKFYRLSSIKSIIKGLNGFVAAHFDHDA